MKKAVAALLVSALVAPAIFSGSSASGSIAQPFPAPQAAPAPASSVAKLTRKIKVAKRKVKLSLVSTLSGFARFKPVPRKTEGQWDQAEQFLTSKTTIEQIYNQEMSKRLRERYEGAVRPFEREANNPNRRASSWEVQRYEQSRKDLANWTMKEVGKAQLKEFIARTKGNSAAISAVASSTSSSSQEAEPKRELTEKERIAQAHRLDRAAMVEEEEEVIPTRLRAKLNLLKAQGQFTFSNPIVVTSVEAKAGSGENLAVELNKDFKKFEMNSKLRYAVDQSLVVFNVNKRITKEVSVDLNSERWTGSKRGSVGEKSKDTAKVLYSVSF